MKTIKCLTDYLEIIINNNETYAEIGREKKNQQPNERAETWVQQFSDSNIKNLSSEHSEKVKTFIDEYADHEYDFAFQRSSSTSEESNSHNDYVCYFRGVSDNKYPIAPGIYRKDEKHDEPQDGS